MTINRFYFIFILHFMVHLQNVFWNWFNVNFPFLKLRLQPNRNFQFAIRWTKHKDCNYFENLISNWKQNLQTCTMLIKNYGIPKVRQLHVDTKPDILLFLKNEGNSHHEGARYSIVEYYLDIDVAIDRPPKLLSHYLKTYLKPFWKSGGHTTFIFWFCFEIQTTLQKPFIFILKTFWNNYKYFRKINIVNTT